jgi:hypothetical protein
VDQPSPPPARQRDIGQLLQLGVDTARAGNRQGARSLFLALTREHPHDVRVWIGLAGVAASRNEQREALQHVLALDPDNRRALQALQRLNGAAPAAPAAPQEAVPREARVTPVLATQERAPRALPAVVEPAAPTSAADEPRGAPFPLLNTLAMGLILLLLVAVGVVVGRALLGEEQRAALPTATAALILQPGAEGTSVAGTAAPQAVPSAAVAGPTAAATAGPSDASPTPGLLPTAGLASTPAAPAASAVAGPGDTTVRELGTIVDADGWSASLLRPDYAMFLDGSIGDLQPTGRFVLAVVAAANNAPADRVLPPDMFVLTDSAGRRMLPVPGASSVYLALFARAQYGDLALEDTFAASSGMRSVPLIFDVPLDSSGLLLTVNGAGPAGWPVGETIPANGPVGP